MKYYLDCEFNGYRGALMSLALVREDGEDLYLIAHRLPADLTPWVRENVVSVLFAEGTGPVSWRADLFGAQIAEFLRNDPLPTIVADWPDDIRYFCECLIIGPGVMIDIPSADVASPYHRAIQFVVERVDAYPTDLPGAVQHNALWDARALRHKLMKNA